MSEATPADHAAAIEAILGRLARLYEEAEMAIEQIGDPDEAFRLATELAARLRAAHDEADNRMGRLRARQAVRIRDKESLSLAGLAERISISKARADQLVRAAAAKTEERAP